MKEKIYFFIQQDIIKSDIVVDYVVVAEVDKGSEDVEGITSHSLFTHSNITINNS